MPDTLILGLGGAGAHVCRRLQERLATEPLREAAPDLLVVDTDRGASQALGSGGLFLGANAAVLDAAYRQPERFRAEWLDREILRDRRLHERGVEGNRMLGRFLLLLPENRTQVADRVRSWLRTHPAPDSGARRRVYLVASAAGGTGGGILADTAYLIQAVAADLETEVDLRGVLFVPPPIQRSLAPNAYAALTELHYFSDPATRYRAHFTDAETAWETRRAPFARVSLLTSVTAEGDVIPLPELQERAVIYLLTATVGDEGAWAAERAGRETTVHLLDPDGNPQVFTTFGTEWVEYPEERLVSAVYRNLVRRSLTSWIQGDEPATLAEIPANVPLRDSDAMARLLTDLGQDGASLETFLEPLRPRMPWLHKAPPHQWNTIDQDIEALVRDAAGSPPSPGQPGRGPMADRFKKIRAQVVSDLRGQAARWLKKDNLSLDRVSRVLNEAATELRTTNDPVSAWEDARDAVLAAKKRLLWCVAAARKDPFLLFWRGRVLRKLVLEYERVAGVYVHQTLRAATLPFLRDLRVQIMEPVRAWSGRVGELSGLFARLSRNMADYESALLERLRRDEEDRRLVLGLLRLPGAETPYVANTGWNLPYCRLEDERAAISELHQGWIERLVDREDGLLADPGRSVLDGPADGREDRLPWLMPAAYSALQEGTATALRDAVMQIDRELQARMEDRLRGWLSASAFQRLAEQHREAVQLEFELRRLVGEAAELPALDPPHVRPAGFPTEYELLFFGEAKEGELPSVVRMVVDAAGKDRPTKVVPSRSPHFLTAIAEHPGFALSRCPAYHHMEEGYQEWLKQPGNAAGLPFNRTDVPWTSATLVTRGRLRDASDVLYLALAFGVLRVTPQGEVPVPGSILPVERGERRFPLPAEFDLAVRQLAGDTRLLDAVGQAVDRTVQSRGQEWCGIQLERAVRGENPLGVRLPGSTSVQQARTERLLALRAATRYDELLEEWARTPTGRETSWLQVGESHFCPACGQDLGADAAALPGQCARCRQVLLPHRIQGMVQSDGFRRIPNPFVVGTPLETRSNVFYGRDDIIETVRDRLIRPASRTILILIGERRCGKTSALRQLQYRLEGDLTPLFIDMQGLTASDLPGFLWWLSWRMKEALDERGVLIELPSFEEFTSGPADFQFETKVLAQVRQKLGGGRVLLMLDEFEVLAQRVMNGTFDSRAFDYIRHLMQHGEGIEFLFAGTHVLRQFAANYVTFLFNIGVFLNVDFLKPENAVRLITEPLATAGVSFTKDALASVLELAGAHAYFTQMFGFHLVERLNRLRKREVTRHDVEEESSPVIAAAGAHLDHVWGQLSGADRLLAAYFVEFCPRGQSCREDELLAAAVRDDPTLRPFIFRSAVEKLSEVGLLRAGTEKTEEGREVKTLRLTAEVYRRWLQTAHPFSRLREEGVRWE